MEKQKAKEWTKEYLKGKSWFKKWNYWTGVTSYRIDETEDVTSLVKQIRWWHPLMFVMSIVMAVAILVACVLVFPFSVAKTVYRFYDGFFEEHPVDCVSIVGTKKKRKS